MLSIGRTTADQPTVDFHKESVAMKHSFKLAAFSVLTLLATTASAGIYDYGHSDRYDRGFDRSAHQRSSYHGRNYNSRYTRSDDYQGHGQYPDYRSGYSDSYGSRYDNTRCNSGYNQARGIRDGYARNGYGSRRNSYQGNGYSRSTYNGGILGLLTGRGPRANSHYGR